MAFFRGGYTNKLHGVNTEIQYNSTVCVCNAHVPSLFQQCANKLISNVHLLSKYECMPLPRVIMSLLMTTAIVHNRVLSIKLLLDNWQEENLVIVLPDGFDTWKMFYLHRYPFLLESRVQNFLSSVIGIVQHVLGWIRQNVSKPLQFIDLGECPVSDSIVEEIATAIIENARVQRIRKGKSLKVEYQKYTIKMNCTLYKENTVRLLLRALNCIKEEKSLLKLVITGVHVMPDVVGPDVFDLLHALDPVELKVLAYERCYAKPNDVYFTKLAKSINKFHHIVAFDFSYVGQKLSWFPAAVNDVNIRLQGLTHLRRLDISYCRLTNCLENLLQGLYSDNKCRDCCSGENISQRGKLQYLSLASCFLSDYDLNFLSQSDHASTLEYLNLSYNKFSTNSLATLLTACKNLKVLEMEWCKLTDDSTETVYRALSSMSSLMFLNIHEISWQDKFINDIGHDCENLPQIRCLVFRQIIVHIGRDGNESKHLHTYLHYANKCFNCDKHLECACKVICYR